VAELKLGLEEVGLELGHGLGVETVLTERVGGGAGEDGVWAQVTVKGVTILRFDGRVGQRCVDD